MRHNMQDDNVYFESSVLINKEDPTDIVAHQQRVQVSCRGVVFRQRLQPGHTQQVETHTFGQLAH